MPKLPDTTDDRLTRLGRLMHEQDDQQMERIKALEAENTTIKGLLFALQCAVAQLQALLPADVTPSPLPEVAAEPVVDLTDEKLEYLRKHLFGTGETHKQIEQGDGNSYTKRDA